jgi:predicted esterase
MCLSDSLPRLPFGALAHNLAFGLILCRYAHAILAKGTEIMQVSSCCSIVGLLALACIGKTDAAIGQETGAVTPAAMPGVKTIERRPEGGLPYYIRMSPKASKEKPSRLIVWLHPSGHAANHALESMITQVFRNGYALLLPSEKAWAYWSDEDAHRLFSKSLPDAGTIEGIDAQKPILVGFSAGGQLALRTWRTKPNSLAGLLIDAAYPVEMHQDGLAVFGPPKSPAIKTGPIYVMAGEDDGGGPDIWRRVEADWRKAGVPLTVHIVPHKGHQWLIDGALLETYLKTVATSSRQHDKTAANNSSKTALAKRPKSAQPTTTDEEFRTWTDAAGSHKIEAKYVGVHDEEVRLERRDGVVLHVPLKKLSAADRRYIEQKTAADTTIR